MKIPCVRDNNKTYHLMHPPPHITLASHRYIAQKILQLHAPQYTERCRLPRRRFQKIHLTLKYKVLFNTCLKSFSKHLKHYFMTITPNQRLAIIFITVACLLSVPLIAMQFSTEVNWDLFDFVVAGVLLLGTGQLIELAIRKVRGTAYRLAVCAGILFVLFIIWAELAVGVFGTPFAGS